MLNKQTKQNKTKQNKTKQNKTKPKKTKTKNQKTKKPKDLFSVLFNSIESIKFNVASVQELKALTGSSADKLAKDHERVWKSLFDLEKMKRNGNFLRRSPLMV